MPVPVREHLAAGTRSIRRNCKLSNLFYVDQNVYIQGGPKVGIQLLKVGFGFKSRFVVLMQALLNL